MRVSTKAQRGVTWGPGEWFVVCVPSIASTQWHPFSAATCSTPQTGKDAQAEVGMGAAGEQQTTIEFVIKSMGPDTWTGECRSACLVG